MNLDIIIDQNHSYKRAIEIAYEKAKMKGGVDEATAQECERILSEPEPDYVYHEINLDQTLRLHEDGCISFRTLSERDAYEHLKIEARRRAAACVADQLDSLWEDAKKTAVDVEPELLKELKLSIDEKGAIRPTSRSPLLDGMAEKQLFEMLNNNSELKKAAEDYIWMLAGLAGKTIEGLSAPYARHFAGARLEEG